MDQELIVPNDWFVVKNHFNEEGLPNVLLGEDILLLKKEGVNLDLGWYGGDEGCFRLYLFKGNWLEGELFEKYSSRAKRDIRLRIEEIFKSFERGAFLGVEGIRINQVNGTGFEQLDDFVLRSTD